MKRSLTLIAVIAMAVSLSLLSPALSFAQGADDAEEPAPGTEDAFIATIDIAAVFALHPKMQYYDQTTGLFIKPPQNGLTFDEFINVTKTRRGDYKKAFDANAPEIKRLKGEIDVLKQDIKKLDIQKAIDASPVNSKYDRAIQEAKDEASRSKLLAERTGELGKIDAKFSADIAAKNKKLADLLDSYEKLQRSLLKVYYLTPEETAKRFDEINREIRETIKLAAKKRGIKAVINLNQMTMKEDKPQQAAVTVAEKEKVNNDLEALLSSGPDYSKVLGIMKTVESGLSKETINTRNPEYSETEYVKMLKQMQSDQVREAVSSKYFTKGFIMNLRDIRSLTAAPIIYGGADLTWLTVIAIMVKNGIPKEKAEIISEVIMNASGK